MVIPALGSATDGDSLSTRHADDSPMLVEEDAAAMAELLLTRLVAQVDKVVDGLLFRQETEQAQESPTGWMQPEEVRQTGSKATSRCWT